MQLMIDIKNENVVDKVLDFLKKLWKEGVEFIEKHFPSGVSPDDDYIERHGREIGMSTDSVDLDDNQRLYDVTWKFYREKYTD